MPPNFILEVAIVLGSEVESEVTCLYIVLPKHTSVPECENDVCCFEVFDDGLF